MDAASPPRAAYRFDRFTLDLARGALLTSGGAELPLRPKSFALLQLLVENAGRLLDRDSIMGAVWPDVFVTDDSITQCVGEIRRALGNEAQRLLRTVPRRGYLFDAAVSRAGPAAATLEELPALIEKTSSQAPPAPEPSEPKGPSISSGAERRQLTVLFCDLVGSSALSERLDPEDFSEVIRSYQERCTAIVVSFGGHVAKYLGDGVLAYFGYPHAHEDAAEQSVRAGLAIIRAIDNLGACPDLTLHVRVGIATGLVVSGPAGEGGQGETAVGRPLNLAARLQEIAEPGAVVVADDTRRLLGEVFALRELGAVGLKGFAHPAHAFEVLAERPSGSRFEARRRGELLPMIGRDWELALVLERWRHAAAGEGRAVLLVGEAGIGKSRLVRAMLDAVTGEEHVALRYQCSPHRAASALWPIIQQLTQVAGFAPGDEAGARLEKLEALLRRDLEDVREAVPLIAALLDLDPEGRSPPLRLSPQQQRARTLTVLVEQLLGLARHRPVLMVLEDAHWIDPTTLELVDQILGRIGTARVMLLLTTRPDDQPVVGNHLHLTRLTLDRLGRGPTEEIIRHLTGNGRLPDELHEQIVAKTDGVPLFIEELTKTVLEAGLLEEHEGRNVPTGPLPPLAVPSTLHDSLMARLDRLPTAKEVAQVGAVIGREFSYQLLVVIAPLREDELNGALEELSGAELVFRRGTPPDASYTFKHALVQDAAYQSLLKSRRQELHARVADALEKESEDVRASRPELLAHHCAHAGRTSRAIELWRSAGEHALAEIVAHHLTEAGLHEPAAEWWLRAGQLATARSAYVEAVHHLRRGLDVLSGLPGTRERAERELRLWRALGAALAVVRSYAGPEVGEAFGHALALCRALAEDDQLFPVLYGLWVHRINRGEFASAGEAAREFVEQAERQGEAGVVLTGHTLVGSVHLMRGEFAAARAGYERTIALYQPDRHRALVADYVTDRRVVARQLLAHALGPLGYWDLARRHTTDALAEARDLGHPATEAYALWLGMVLWQVIGEVGTVEAHVERLAGLARELRSASWLGIATAYRGWAQAAQGEAATAIPTIRDGLATLRATGAAYLLPHYLTLLAAAHRADGDAAAALSVLAEAAAEARRTGEGWSFSEILRLEGEVLASMPTPHPAAAETRLHDAMELARARDARGWELRAATSLARLWAEHGERRKARDLLTPIHGWFTEGFGTQDLRNAKVLLDELASA